MTVLIKLTDQNGQTRGGTQWGPGVTHEVRGTGAGMGSLCSPNWLHFYEGLGVALLHNSLGADFQTPRAWRAVARVGRRETLKAGTRRLTTVEEVTYVSPTTEQLVTVAILLAFDHYRPDADAGAWGAWAVNWLSGGDRSKEASAEAWAAASAEAWAAKAAAASAATWVAASAATSAAKAATWAAKAAAESRYVQHVNAVACAVFGY